MADVNLKLRPIDPDAPGFLPRLQQLLAAKRSLSDFQSAQPEDIDKVYELLAEHITEPEVKAEKLTALKKLTQTQLATVFDSLMGAKTVPPESGAG
jgi:hypothetical protein